MGLDLKEQLEDDLFPKLDEQLDWPKFSQLGNQLYSQLYWPLNGQLNKQLKEKYDEK